MELTSRPRVVIIGGGFGGLAAAKSLKHTQAEVILIDRKNHHLFQPLLYQVATAALSPADIARPIRSLFRKFRNVVVVMDEVTDIDPVDRQVITNGGRIKFDYLIVAIGNRHSYFGHPEWEKYAPGLKTISDALDIREKILLSFEHAERFYRTPDVSKYLTFVIVGGGPTGVELAGAIAEIARKTMLPDFPLLKREDIKVFLIEAGSRVLSTYPEDLSAKALESLTRLGVTVCLNSRVQKVDEGGVDVNGERITSVNVIWAAGNAVSSLLASLGGQRDRAGRVFTNRDCSVPGLDSVFVIGDAAAHPTDDGTTLPGVAQVAMQQGRYVARIISKKIPPEKRLAFHYKDKGSMATIGRAKAVAVVGKLKFSGFLAWALWCVIHIFFLIGFHNRWRVFTEWIWYYVTFQPGARLIYKRQQNEDGPKTSS